MTIHKKFIFAELTILAAAAVVGVLSILGGRSIVGNVNQVVDSNFPALKATHALHELVEETQLLFAEAIDRGRIDDQLRTSIAELQSRFFAKATELHQITGDEEIAVISERFATYTEQMISEIEAAVTHSESSAGQLAMLSAMSTLVSEGFERIRSTNEETLIANLEESAGIAQSFRACMLALFFGMIACVVLIYLGLRTYVLQPIDRMASALENIAQGEGDLTRRLEGGNDEVGTMAKWFNLFVDRIHSMIRSVADSATGLYHSSNALSDTSTRMAGNANDMQEQAGMVVASVEELSTTVTDVAIKADAVSSSVQRVAATTEQLSYNVGSIASAAEHTNTTISSVATSIEEMSSSLAEVARNCVQAADASTTSNERAKAASEQMTVLGQAAERIGKVVELINDIADRTNLLALNATIEAASAGEAGKGFAVVANEVKELAKQTGKATGEIAGQVEAMQRDSRATMTMIQEVSALIDEVSHLSNAIASAVEEQTTTTNEIAENVANGATAVSEISHRVQEMSGGIDDLARASSEAAAGVRDIAGAIAEMVDRTGEMASSLGQVNGAAENTAQGAGTVNDEAQQLTSLAGGLSQLVGQFRT